MPRCPTLRPLLLPALLLLLATAAAAQEPGAPPPSQLRVFLECPPCDFDFVRTEVAYVDWMRDRADADLHVLVRMQPTGGGGRQHEMEFIGLGRHLGKGDTLVYLSGRDDTADLTRRGLLRTLEMGMMRYLAGTPAAERIRISLDDLPAGAGTRPAAEARDPWDFWVFTVGGNTFLRGESSSAFANLNGNLRAERVTPAWKVELGLNGSYNRQSFTYQVSDDDEPVRDTTVVSLQRATGMEGLLVRSVNGRASAGAQLGGGMSTRENLDLFVNVGPAVEYNLFPYDESTRRQLTFRYGVGLVSNRYIDETIFLRTAETHWNHSLRAGYATRQTWGNVNLSVTGQQYFFDTSLFNMVFSGGTQLNLVRGLRLNLNGNYEMVRDQLGLPKRTLTAEEVLLQQRQLKTSFNYFMSVGLSYRFGSGVQNVVNPRFPGIGGGGGFFF